ncbi:MAG: hypothetical protein ACTSU5_11655 [Promethearchaeota archaeon]
MTDEETNLISPARAGEMVTVEGVAANGKAGALVLAHGDTPVYIDGLDGWDPGLLSRRVVATGVLAWERHFPEMVVDPETGAISQGSAGKNLVLKDATWTTPGE